MCFCEEKNQGRESLICKEDRNKSQKEKKDKNNREILSDFDFIYKLIQKKSHILKIIQCASNNNEYTRVNYKNFISKNSKVEEFEV
jgi:hypothetical protein